MRKTISATNGFSFQYGGPPTANHSQQHSTATGYQQNIQMRNNHLTGSTPALHNHPPNGGGLLNNGNSANGYKKGISSSTQHLHSQPSLTGGVQQRGDQNSPAYYYSSTLGTPSRSSAGAGSQQAPATQREQFHSTTTTLRSNKETPTDQRSMDYKSSAPNSIPPASQFGRRHTAAGAHEFHGGPALPQQHIPAYSVEHLASFAVGKQFGLTSPSDGVRKLKQMERNSAICPVPMLFTLHPDRVAVLEENGTLVEEFPLALVTDPTAHISSDPDDFFNNVLLFVVREHDVPSSSSGGVVPTEMHIFQCIGVSAQEAAEDLHHYTRGHFHKVRPGRRGIGASNGSQSHNMPPYQAVAPAGPYPIARAPYPPREDDMVGAESNGAEYFEMDVNTLNRCFDDIERFVARIQSAAIAQRELDMQQRRSSSKKRGGKKDKNAQAAAQNGILQLRAQMPSYGEFSEIFQKFKLCFNLLAKLKNHIHEPSAPELLHFLFTPLMVILDACQWGLGQQVAQQVYSPLLSLDACELLRTYLYPKEMEVWMALGKAWNTAPEDWPGPLPPPYRPVFLDGYAPYGYPQQGAARLPPPAATRWDSRPTNGRPQPQAPFPQQHPPRYSSAPAPIHRGMSAPTMPQQPPPRPQQSNFYGGAYGQVPPATSASTANLIAAKIDNIELERINLEKERLEFERRKVLDKERELLEQERRLREEAERLEHERRQLHRESEKHSIAESDRPDFYRGVPSMHASPRLDRRTGSVQVLPNGSSNGHAPASSSSTHSNTATYAPISSPRLRNGQQSSQTMLEQSSPRQKAFLEDLARRGCKVVQVTYDRNACNAKELTVTRGEYLEVLNDSRNWWECRNVHSRSGFVPHTILSVLSLDDWEQEGGGMEEPGGKPAVHERKQRQIAAAESAPSSAAVPAADCLSKIPLEVRQEQRYVPELLESMRKKDRLGARRTSSVHSSSSAPSLDANSDHQQVQQWLMQKGFSEQTRTALSLCSAKDLFEMEKEEFDLLCGEAADRIHSLVLAAKRQSNYDQASADEKQLNNLLTIRRLALESQEDQNDQMLKEPAERPPTLGRSQSYKLAFMAREVKEEEPPEREEECVEAHSVRSYL